MMFDLRYAFSYIFNDLFSAQLLWQSYSKLLYIDKMHSDSLSRRSPGVDMPASPFVVLVSHPNLLYTLLFSLLPDLEVITHTVSKEPPLFVKCFHDYDYLHHKHFPLTKNINSMVTLST